MIFTVGDPTVYEPLLDKQPGVRKRGRDEECPGGSVWATREEAQPFADRSGYRVYGVLADWETQTEPSCSGGAWHDLLVDAVLVRLDPQPDTTSPTVTQESPPGAKEQ